MEIGERPTVLLGVGGGIAAYKAVALTSLFHQAGYETHLAMTPAATRFVAPLSFAAIINRPVLTDIFPDPAGSGRQQVYPHLFPATHAHFCVLAPATADLIAKVAHGFGDDIVSACVLSLPANCRRFFCPAMNVEMWRQPVVQENVEKLGRMGWQRIGPDSGYLACGVVGEGRMAEANEIFSIITASLPANQRLANRRVLILSGPTIEHLDPVRFISNHSSGKMGKALAAGCAHAGAEVTFITGPVSREYLPQHSRITILPINSAVEMLQTAQSLFQQADIVLYAAAVADFMATKTDPQKVPKTTGNFTLEMTSTPDVAATLNQNKRPGQWCVGFALETGADAHARAREKLHRKNLDAIVLNGVDSFGADTGTFTYLAAGAPDSEENWGQISKTLCAARIIEKIPG